MKENKIPSAEEFLKSKGYAKPSIIAVGGNDVIKLMIEFTKLHVKAALESAAKKVKTEEKIKSSFYNKSYWKIVVNKKSILSAYSEELIK